MTNWTKRTDTVALRLWQRRIIAGAAVAMAAIAVPAKASVADANTIDALQAEAGKNTVCLVIVQDRGWSPESHVMLGDKIGGYMRYILGGQLQRDNPQAGGKSVRIVLVSQTPPAEHDEAVLGVFREQLVGSGIEFVWGGENALLDMVGAH